MLGDKNRNNVGKMKSVAAMRANKFVTIDLNRFISAELKGNDQSGYWLHVVIKGSGWYKYLMNENFQMYYENQEDAYEDHTNLVSAANQWIINKSK